MFKLTVYVPSSHLQQLKQVLFAAGAGRQGNYDNCCWQSLGQGQFRPLPGSTPFLGATNKLETVAEYKLELLCAEQFKTAVIAALVSAHPYESPAYDFVQLVD